MLNPGKKNLPLEFHRFSINSIQFAEIIVVQISLDLLLPGLKKIVSHFPKQSTEPEQT